MSRKPIVITDHIQVRQISVQPGELWQEYPLDVSSLLSTGEIVVSVTSDNPAAVPVVTCSGSLVLLDIAGPANGVSEPVRLTVHGSTGSIRIVALLILGCDPFVNVVPAAPNVFLRWRGVWRDDADYLPYDLVVDQGVIYLAQITNSGTRPEANIRTWFPWAGAGGGGTGGGGVPIILDAGGTGRLATLRATWFGPGDDDWQLEVVGA